MLTQSSYSAKSSPGKNGMFTKAPCRWSHLTVHVSIVSCSRDPFALDLDVLSAGSAVELVDPDLSAAELVRHFTLRPHILLKIRRRVILPLFMQREK